MILFETQVIYGVDEEQACATVRKGTVLPEDIERFNSIEDAYEPLIASGLHPHDFGMFISLADEHGVAEIPYLVTEYKPDGSTIIPFGMVDAAPQCASFELARKLQSLDHDELAQFGINLVNLAKALSNRYPFRYK